MRVFLAIPSDGDWADAARRLVGRLQACAPPAAWTRPESWHVTLKFLGEVAEGDAERFAAALADVAAATPGGALTGARALLLPPGGRPRVLGLGFAPESTALAPLVQLAGAAERVSRALRLVAEDRPFRPHVTLARLRAPWGREAVDAYRRAADDGGLPAWPVRRCVLYGSRLTPSGAVHTPLREWALAPIPEAVNA